MRLQPACKTERFCPVGQFGLAKCAALPSMRWLKHLPEKKMFPDGSRPGGVACTAANGSSQTVTWRTSAPTNESAFRVRPGTLEGPLPCLQARPLDLRSRRQRRGPPGRQLPVTLEEGERIPGCACGSPEPGEMQQRAIAELFFGRSGPIYANPSAEPFHP